MQSTQVEVTVCRPGHPDRRVMLGMGTTHLGRAEDNDVVLPDVGVSRRHARIMVESSGVYVEDMGSGNGTYCRGQRVQRQELQDGDEVLIDPYVLGFSMRGPADLPDEDTGLVVSDDDTAPMTLSQRQEFEPEERPSARLVVLAGHRLEASYQLGSVPTTLGRSDQRSVVLYDPAASRLHVEIKTVGKSYVLYDSGSANGTFVNTQRVREWRLAHGDRIRIGSTEFRFELLAPGGVRGWALGGALPAWRKKEEQPSEPGMNFSDPGVQPPPARDRGILGAGPIGLPAMLLGGLAFGVFIVGLGALFLAWEILRGPSPWLGAVIDHPTEVQAVEISPEEQAEVAALMEEGMNRFRAQRYLEAASAFYKVLKVDPTHEAAERMGYVACEYIALNELRYAILERSTPASKRKKQKKTAISLAKKAMESMAEIDGAVTALREALVYYPDDKRLKTAFKDVRRMERRDSEATNED